MNRDKPRELLTAEELRDAMFEMNEGFGIVIAELIISLRATDRMSDAEYQQFARMCRMAVSDLDKEDLVRFTVEQTLALPELVAGHAAWPDIRERYRERARGRRPGD